MAIIIIIVIVIIIAEYMYWYVNEYNYKNDWSRFC